MATAMANAAPIGFRIKERRRALGVTQSGMAKELGISASYLNLIEANKRPIAGTLLRRIARRLDLDLDLLTGETERRLIADLGEAAAEPLLRQAGVAPETVPEFVGRYPAWGAALLGALRAVRAGEQTVAALSDRLAQDPVLSDALHRIITHVTAIRSTAEILSGEEALPAPTRSRFDAIIDEESARLATAAQSIVRYLEPPKAGQRPTVPAEEVDDHFIAAGNHFPALEAAGDELRRVLKGYGNTMDAALAEYLAASPGSANADTTTAEPTLGGSEPPETRRFRLAREAALRFAAAAIEAEVAGASLTTDAARLRARRALASYVAGACLLPYAPFLEAAERCRYDIDILSHQFAASFEQVAHRLVTLRAPGAAGVPFGFLRADPAGYLTKRFPLPGLGISRSGTGCPLWAIYTAFQAPQRPQRQLVEFPNRARFLFIARTVAKPSPRFHEPPFLRSVMLICDAIHADRTVYADGLDLSARVTTTPVGSTCRLCPRKDCRHRAEAAIVAL